ncbi:MAG: penicillin-binding protein 2 [Elusimicrobia bacterium]|nr:penicillin-binding protein 2 [Elusimicrobiota bacterium]
MELGTLLSAMTFRLFLPLAAIFFLYGAVAVRLGQLQIVRHGSYAKMTASEVVQTRRVRPMRGRILDRRGRVLGVSVEMPSLFVSRRETDIPPERLALQIARVISGVDQRDLMRRLRGSSNFVWIKRQVVADEAEALRRLGIKGIGIELESKRRYPWGKTAAELIGSVGIDGEGTSGLERQLNPLLQGKEEVRVVLRDALGKVFAEEDRPESMAIWPWSRGHDEGPFDVYLTLDAQLQSSTEAHLEEALAHQDARAAVAVVVHVRTGALLAMASRTEAGFEDGLGFSLDPNLAVSYTFEPGSVVKPFVLAAALDAGVVQETDEIDCENGRWHPTPSLTISDHEPYGLIPLSAVIAHSSNIGFAKIGMALGQEGLYQAYRAFGFGSRTALPVTGESVGIVRPPAGWSAVSLPMMSFGYEIGTTPLQLTQAYAALANGGILLEPQIVDRIKGFREERRLYAFSSRKVRQALPQNAAKRAMVLMEGVVAQGTGKSAQMAGYPTAGKTGTAQKIDPKTRLHTPNHVVVSFCGALPMPEPELAACVILDDPRKPKVAWASDLAAPLFKKIMQEAIVNMGLKPALSAQNVNVVHQGPT